MATFACKSIKSWKHQVLTGVDWHLCFQNTLDAKLGNKDDDRSKQVGQYTTVIFFKKNEVKLKVKCDSKMVEIAQLQCSGRKA